MEYLLFTHIHICSFSLKQHVSDTVLCVHLLSPSYWSSSQSVTHTTPEAGRVKTNTHISPPAPHLIQGLKCYISHTRTYFYEALLSTFGHCSAPLVRCLVYMYTYIHNIRNKKVAEDGRKEISWKHINNK